MSGTKRDQSRVVRVSKWSSHFVSSACIKNHPTSPASLQTHPAHEPCTIPHTSSSSGVSQTKPRLLPPARTLTRLSHPRPFLITNNHNIPANTFALLVRQYSTTIALPLQLPQVTRLCYHYPSNPTPLGQLPHEPSRTIIPPLPLFNTVAVVAPHRSRLPLFALPTA